MEDLFDILLVVIVAIIGGIAKSNKNKKKKAADKPAKVIEPIAEPAKPIAEVPQAITKQNIENAIAAFSELLESEKKPAQTEKNAAQSLHGQTSIEAELQKAAPSKAKKKKKLKSGESPVDEHGCIGGTMPAHQAEGESLAEHAEHEKERQQHLQQTSPAPYVENLRRPSNQELRRAIVMSEVLDKPVSLRERRL